MAVATRSSSAALVKAAVLPLILVLLAVAAGASNTEDGPAVAEAGGRFPGTPQGRKLLALLNGCESLHLFPHGPAPNFDCSTILFLAKKPICCPGLSNISTCFDGAIDFSNCGSCGNKCVVGQVCCSGVCTPVKNLLTDKNNCGSCGTVCRVGLCKGGVCNY